MATTPQPIVNTILADVNAIIPNFSSLVSSYRLLVGSAEEIHRIPGVPEDIFIRSVERFDHTGTLIDILLELLCCKISYSSDFLGITCAPIDLFRLLTNRTDVTDTPYRTGDQILQLEVLRRALDKCRGTPSGFKPGDIPSWRGRRSRDKQDESPSAPDSL